MNNSAIQLRPGEDGARGAPAGRNKVMNGQFTFWQRGLVFPPNVVAFDGQQGIIADRWSWQATLNGGTFNLADLGMARGDWADPGDPASFGIDGDPDHFMRFQSSLTGTGGGAATNLVERIEGVDHFNGRKATLSFWARSEGLVSPTGTIAVSILQFFGAGGSTPVTLPAAVDIFLTTTWTYYTLTFDMPSITGKTIAGGNDSLRVRFHNHIDAAIATILGFVGPIAFTDVLNLTNVQLELGEEASSYETQDEATVLAGCQRYFCKSHDIDTVPFNMSAVPGVLDLTQNNTPGIYEVHGQRNSGGQGGTEIFPVRMRAAPSLLVVQVSPSQSNQPPALESMAIAFIGEGSMSVLSPVNSILAFLWTADAEL